MSKGKEKVQEEDLGDEEERDFDRIEHEEPQKHFTHHGIGIIDLEAQDEKTIKDIIIQEREAQIQALADNLERAKFIIKYLEQENKKLSDNQVLMELQMVKADRQMDKEAHVTFTPIEQEI